MRIFRSGKDLTPEERSLKSDFGTNLRFASYEDLGDAFCTDFLCSEKLEERTEKIGQAKVNVYADGDGNRVVELTIDVPVFDSGDREYDSWHSLYLTRGMKEGTADGYYCKGGYRLASAAACRDLTDADPRVREILREQGILPDSPRTSV